MPNDTYELKYKSKYMITIQIKYTTLKHIQFMCKFIRNLSLARNNRIRFL